MRDMRSPPRGLTDRVQDWVARNRALTAAIVAFLGTGCVLLYGNKRLNSKRRKARKAGNGSRKEIVGTLRGCFRPDKTCHEDWAANERYQSLLDRRMNR
jgi:hypothetical protein